MKHTPGPLHSDGEFIYAAKPDGTAIRVADTEICHGDEGFYSEEEADANLKRLVHCWNCHDELVGLVQDAAYPGGLSEAMFARWLTRARDLLEKEKA